MHRHWCEIAGHEYECNENSCKCICGELMEGHDHSDCPIEFRPCPEHSVKIESSDNSEAPIKGLFREPTPEEHQKFQEKRRILKQLVFYDLTGQSSEADFDEADFLKAVGRCEVLGFSIHGVDVFTKDMRYLATEFGAEDSEGASWCRDGVKKWFGKEGVVYSATYDVPDKFLGLF